jgi:hypothetical protein
MSKMRDSVVLPIAAASMIALLGGCPETKQVSMTAVPAPSFLPDSTLLQQGKAGQVDLVYANPSANWASYTKMILDPVTIWAGPGSNLNQVSQKTQQGLANAFYSALYGAASKRCQMVSDPGPNTMRWRVALIDATSANPALNTVSTYIPQLHILDEAAGYAFNDGVAYFVGEATAEAYAKDASTGTLLWEGADQRAGNKTLRGGTFNSWGDVDHAFQAWADQFAKRLADWGACPQKKTS